MARISKSRTDLSALEQEKQFLFDRQRNYLTVFNPEAPTTKEVLDDLMQFCMADQSTFNVDGRIQAMYEGRRQVWLRIQQHLQLDSQSLWELMTTGKVRR